MVLAINNVLTVEVAIEFLNYMKHKNVHDRVTLANPTQPQGCNRKILHKGLGRASSCTSADREMLYYFSII
jgi:hypothetical protein